ncbi:MAG TPA: hypothetical protein VFB72_00045 [Verrucomicrobiae bacterium]|nr:hypothetical protein [Verrucomicrobiae bacterium]
MGITSKEPATVRLSAVYRDTMPGQLRRLPAAAGGHGQRVPAPRVSDLADNNDLFQLADTTNHRLLVSRRKGNGKSIPAGRRLAWIEKHHVVGH